MRLFHSDMPRPFSLFLYAQMSNQRTLTTTLNTVLRQLKGLGELVCVQLFTHI